MALDFINSKLKALCVHQVGNNTDDASLILSDNLVTLNNEVHDLLLHYFTASFDFGATMHFYHDDELLLNEAYTYVSRVFKEPSRILEQSILLARHLFNKSSHQNIKKGELYVAHICGINFDGAEVEAIGLFKSENKDAYLEVYNESIGYNINYKEGVNINKLDKGCIVINIDASKGYIVYAIDKSSKGADAKYWIEDFLGVKPRHDKYFQTQNYMSICKNFVTKQLPSEFEMSKADQVELLNRSMQYFKENEKFSIQDFSSIVLEQSDVIESFNSYKERYQSVRDITLEDSFSISGDAVKKHSRSFKSVIKLDKNFHIYVHGDRRMIEQGEDEKGRYYKVYYNEEY